MIAPLIFKYGTHRHKIKRPFVGAEFVKLWLCRTHFQARAGPIKLNWCGLTPSSQTTGYLLRTLSAVMPAGKMDSAKYQFDELFVDHYFWLYVDDTGDPYRRGKLSTKVVLIRLGIYLFVNKAKGGGSPKFFINTL